VNARWEAQASAHVSTCTEGKERALSLVTIGGDIVTAVDGTRIRDIDDLSTYLEEHTSADQTISVLLVRNSEALTLLVTLGVRPPPT
jgi:S1-C subfamily serine protease